ncbi:NAD(P)/FAD-dependent oxidoreductase [Haloechinothrix salitolerans]|uniref:NAD(P)/FAD-dependent oxidoreductase n=1 Tax=Haloechinothrix salitolerans TaxID=926830 RepID=A0ABW2BUC5_9PSEU
MSRLVVVGASLAGLRAVESARRAGFTGAITLLGAEEHLPYDRPPLSKEFLTGDGTPKHFRTEDALRTDLDVDLRLGTPATGLDVEQRVILAGNDAVPYTAAVLATGATARTLPGLPALSGLHTLRTLDDAHTLRGVIRPGGKVVIVGAGFIGSELACSARRMGAEVTLVEAAPVPFTAAVGDEMAPAITALHTRNGTDLRCGVTVTGIDGDDRVKAVRLGDGTTLPADVVVIGVGAAPATGWLAGSGLKVDDGVVCDETLATSAPGVYAAGDVARWFNPLFGETMRLEHWTSAAEQGALAARNAIDPSAATPCTLVPYFWSDLYDSRVQFVGVPTADEVRVVAGGVGEDTLLALYRRGDRLIGALGVEQRRPVLRMRALIGKRVTWDDALEAAAE